MPRMANQPRPDNPGRVVRVDDELWALVKAIAAENEVSASEVVREALRAYVKRTRAD